MDRLEEQQHFYVCPPSCQLPLAAAASPLELNVGLMDVAKGCNLIAHSIKDHKRKAVLRLVCVMHALQNAIKRSSRNIDAAGVGGTPPYSTQVMRVCNVWRSFGHHVKLRDFAVARYGQSAASAHFKCGIGGIVRTR